MNSRLFPAKSLGLLATAALLSFAPMAQAGCGKCGDEQAGEHHHAAGEEHSAHAERCPHEEAGKKGHHGHHGKHGAKHGKRMMDKDANGDGVVSKREFLAHAQAKFAKMDANGDGQISDDELVKRCEHHAKGGDPKKCPHKHH